MFTHSEFAVGLSRYFLIPMGIWPLEKDASSCRKFLNYVAIILNYGFIFFILIPCVLFAFIENKNMSMRIKLFGPISFCLMAIGKYAILIRHTDLTHSCFLHIEEDWQRCRQSQTNAAELEAMMRNAGFGRILIIISVLILASGAIFYQVIMPLFSIPVAAVYLNISATDNVSIREEILRIRGLAYPVYHKLMDVQKSPTYELVYVGQIISGYVVCVIPLAMYSTIAILVMHACGQLDVVMNLCRGLVDDQDDKLEDQEKWKLQVVEIRRKIGNLVEKHLRVLSFASKIEENINEICFLEFLGSTFNICLAGYYCLSEWERSVALNTFTYCMMLSSFIFNIFLLCYIGEFLTEQQCKQVGEVAYMIPWYRMPQNMPRDILLIMLISRRPAKIPAGKLVDLTLITFASVMKTACTYLQLLRTLSF